MTENRKQTTTWTGTCLPMKYGWSVEIGAAIHWCVDGSSATR